MINSVDEFIIYDDIEYSHGTWRNRNRILTPAGAQWLTIPVRKKGCSGCKIDQIVIADPNWAAKHWKTLVQNYAKSPFFKEYEETFKTLYMACEETYLSRINLRFIRAINDILGITTPITLSSDLGIRATEKSERLIEICRKTCAGMYLSGPAAKVYLNESLFADHNIGVEWMDNSGYPEYPQLQGIFDHKVTVLDLIFNTGANAVNYMKSFGQGL